MPTLKGGLVGRTFAKLVKKMGNTLSKKGKLLTISQLRFEKKEKLTLNLNEL